MRDAEGREEIDEGMGRGMEAEGKGGRVNRRVRT